MSIANALKKQASEEENDFKSFALMAKALRESRSEKFVEDWLPLLKKRFDIVEGVAKYTITTYSHGIIDYFPKANSVLIRKDNQWIKPGSRWIGKHLLEIYR